MRLSNAVRRFSVRKVTLTLLVGLGSCTKDTPLVLPTPTVQSVSVVPTAAQLQVSQTTQLVAAVSVTGGASTNVTWTSSNVAVATVAASGNAATVTGVGAGTATITATSASDATKSASATVTVT